MHWMPGCLDAWMLAAYEYTLCHRYQIRGVVPASTDGPSTPMNALVNTEFGLIHGYGHVPRSCGSATRPCSSKGPIVPRSAALFMRSPSATNNQRPVCPNPQRTQWTGNHGIRPSCHGWAATIHDPVAVAASDALCKCRRSSLAPVVLPPASTPMRQAVWGRASRHDACFRGSL